MPAVLVTSGFRRIKRTRYCVHHPETTGRGGRGRGGKLEGRPYRDSNALPVNDPDLNALTAKPYHPNVHTDRCTVIVLVVRDISDNTDSN